MIRRVLFALFLCVALSGAAHCAELIQNFVSDVDVQPNGDLLVTESITVQAERLEIRRGILRDFPTSYVLPGGRRVVVGFDVLSVERNGQKEPYAIEYLDNGKRIRIGSGAVLLSRGLHTYTIKYRTTRQIGFFQDFDELYWNVTGNGWTFAIENAVATIRLPAGAQIQARAFYTGAQGEKGTDARIVGENGNVIVFRTTRQLLPRNGLTISIAWQKGIVSPPGAYLRAVYLFFDNIAISLSVIGFALVFFYFLYQWLRYGRDPAKGTIIPLFAAPPEMSAAAMRYVDRHNSYDNKTFTAAIVELAVKGHVTIKEEGGVTTLERRDGGKPLKDEEEAIKRHFFPKEKHRSIELKRENHIRVGGANTALKERLHRAYDGYFRDNYGKWWLGLLFTFIAVVFCLAGIVLQFPSRYATDAFIGTLLPILPLLLASFALNNGFTSREGKGFLLGVGVLFGILPAALGLWYVAISVDGYLELIPTICAFASTMLCAFYLEWMQAPTKEGRKALDHIEGLRVYLSTADESARLEAFNPPEKTPELFERMLPYAIALDVETSWAAKFRNVLAAAALGPATAAATATAFSSWYSGDRDVTQDLGNVTSAVSSSLTTVVASSSTAPGTSSSYSGSSDSSSSSSSFSGGSSGGGGGGGGGSGW
jgi:hypothetical protein